jgi:Na+:H+ antiporter
MHDIALTVLGVTGLLALVSLLPPLAARLNLPYSILLAGVGCALGAIVVTTDPVAVVGIFRDLGAPRRLAILVEGESLFNDAAAIALFSLLVAMLLGEREADAVGTGLAFLKGFVGGAAVGFIAARVTMAVVGLLRGLRLAEITLTVALAYLVFVIAEHYLHVSGVVAVVIAGLVTGSHGRMRITPSTWDTLVETWEQLGFWASSLIFLFAAMLVPRLLINIGLDDAELLALLIVATLGARAIVIYGLLPLLSASSLAERVSNPYKAVMLWGGLRGAISLALALAVAENDGLPAEIRHFVATLTTGFVLFTLFVNGMTLRPLLRLLHLDRLSPVDRAVRDRALMLSLTAIKEHIESIAVSDRVEQPVATEISGEFAKRIAAVKQATEDDIVLSDTDLLKIGLITLASREQELYLQRFKERIVSRKIVQTLVARSGWLIDGAKVGGRTGYEDAARRAIGFPWTFRLALALHHRFGAGRQLATELADRFERLLIVRMALQRLSIFSKRHLAPLLGSAAGQEVATILEARSASLEQALAALKLQYPDYARTLEARYLGRVAARLEEAEYRSMLEESMISREVYNDLDRRLSQRWQELERRPMLDIELKREEMIARVPLFTGLDASRLAAIARVLRPRLALPGERIVAKGEHGDAMYFIASGAVEVKLDPNPVRLGSGDFFGEIALVTNLRRTADVVALGYCRLLTLQARDFTRLLDADDALRQRIDAVAHERLGAAAQAAK